MSGTGKSPRARRTVWASDPAEGRDLLIPSLRWISKPALPALAPFRRLLAARPPTLVSAPGAEAAVPPTARLRAGVPPSRRRFASCPHRLTRGERRGVGDAVGSFPAPGALPAASRTDPRLSTERVTPRLRPDRLGIAPFPAFAVRGSGWVGTCGFRTSHLAASPGGSASPYSLVKLLGPLSHIRGRRAPKRRNFGHFRLLWKLFPMFSAFPEPPPRRPGANGDGIKARAFRTAEKIFAPRRGAPKFSVSGAHPVRRAIPVGPYHNVRLRALRALRFSHSGDKPPPRAFEGPWGTRRRGKTP